MVRIILTEFESVYFDSEKKEMVSCKNSEFLRYLKGVYSNKQRFIGHYIEPKSIKLLELKEKNEEAYNNTIWFFDFLVEFFDDATPFTMREAFELENREFQGLVFSSIDISNMISELGATKIKADGINVNHRQYDRDGNFTGMKEYHNIYETYQIDGSKLGVEEPLYVVKCWCTSTNKEHWIWIKDEYKDDPLTAIASTFVIHKNLIPHIKCLKRQGDLLMVEMNEDVKPEGEEVSLTKEQYFGFLVAQS